MVKMAVAPALAAAVAAPAAVELVGMAAKQWRDGSLRARTWRCIATLPQPRTSTLYGLNLLRRPRRGVRKLTSPHPLLPIQRALTLQRPLPLQQYLKVLGA
jgi:hypothetical protein